MSGRQAKLEPMNASGAVRWAYGIALACGAAAAAFAIYDGYEVYSASITQHGGDWFRFDGWRVLERGAGVVVLALTAAHFAFAFRSNTHWVALPVYILSYVACGFTAWYSLLIAGKDFAGIGVMAELLRVGMVWFAPAALLAIAGLTFVSRSFKPSS